MKGRIFILFFLLLTGFNASAQKYEIDRRTFGNSSNWEVAPVWYGDDSADTMLFLSNKPSTGAVEFTDDEGNRLTNIYIVGRKENGEWGNPVLFDEDLTTNSHDGPITFTKNKKMLCVVRQYGYKTPGFEKSGSGGLFFAYKDGDSWSGIVPFEHNREDLNFYSPFLTPEGDTLFFAAENMPDSYGGFDIYMSRLVDGSWTAPENLGPNINTSEWDCYPFLHASGQLYFSSEGHRAMRKDIFVSRKYNETWLPAIPLQIEAINDRYDQYAFIISADYNKGYYTRKVNTGVQSDIWGFSFPVDDNKRIEKVKKNRYCFRLRENSLDTIDYDIFDYKWMINDTVIPGHDIQYCFPGPGDYQIDFYVTNKLTDTTIVGASMFFQLELISQAVISLAGSSTLPDTLFSNEEMVFSAENTYLPDVDIAGYIWDFGDGTKMTGEKVRKTYAFPSLEKYMIKLTVLERIGPRDYQPYKTFEEEILVVPGK